MGKKVNPIQIQKFLKGVDYPAKKDALVKHAQKSSAPKEILSVLKLIADKDYKNPAEVSKGVGAVKQ